jgi:hypothetical protein
MRSTNATLTTLLIFSLSVGIVRAASPNTLSFAPMCGVSTDVVAIGPEVTVTVKKGSDVKTEKIQVETEKNLKLSVDDYNFDGHPDFAISHIDDGMGTYTIYQIYIYSPKENKFVLLSPKCGDEFVNMVVSKKKRTLTNSYMVENEFKTCTMKF